MKALVVLSGGMDSATALALLVSQGHEVEAITFNYGSKHNAQEGLTAKELAAHYGIKRTLVDLPFINELFKSDLLKSGGEIPEGHYADPVMKKTVVPFRNGIMLAIAAGFAESIGADMLILGNHAGDHAVYPDCRPEFADAMADAINHGTYKEILLSRPFENISKGDIVVEGVKLGVPYHLTYSCYKGEAVHCGKCGTCYERKEAFRDAGVNDPTLYKG